MTKGKLVIQVPDEVIRNKHVKFDSNTFALYTYLKYLQFRNYGSNELELNHNHIKHKLYMSDNRTLKKCLFALHQSGAVMELINKLPTKGNLKLTFDPDAIQTETFTQLPVTVINKIEHIGTTGMRLMFYYESFINRTDDISKQYAFPALETTSLHTGLNKETIVRYNDILKKHKLIKITKHKLEWNGEYDTLDQALITKYNNHYFVNIDKL
ncbi:hypothetical protein [Rossellomorea marisflavi]|uniref:hypothetical protein n=1 Tax=Rossellomorea marisflavi TaxID=189381 RepID=UPI003FA0662C